MVFEIRAGKDVEQNSKVLLNVFKPLILKLSKKFSRGFKIPFKVVREAAELECLKLFSEYDYFRNDNFQAFLKMMLDRRLLFFCQTVVKNGLRYTTFSGKEVHVFQFEVSDNSFLKRVLILMKGKPERERRMIYFFFFRRLKKANIARLFGLTVGRVTHILGAIEKEAKEVFGDLFENES